MKQIILVQVCQTHHKSFRPEVIDTLQSVTDVMDIVSELSDANSNKKIKDILSQIEGELDFIQDENVDMITTQNLIK